MKYTLLTLSFLTLFSCGKKEEMKIHQATEKQIHATHSLDVKVDNRLDPVCEMETAGHLSDTIHYNGKIYGFCSAGCKETFAKTPEQFLSKMN